MHDTKGADRKMIIAYNSKLADTPHEPLRSLLQDTQWYVASCTRPCNTGITKIQQLSTPRTHANTYPNIDEYRQANSVIRQATNIRNTFGTRQSPSDEYLEQSCKFPFVHPSIRLRTSIENPNEYNTVGVCDAAAITKSNNLLTPENHASGGGTVDYVDITEGTPSSRGAPPTGKAEVEDIQITRDKLAQEVT